jgi:hypothetical protein
LLKVKVQFNSDWLLITDPGLDTDLVDVEQKEIVRRYKFGLIYQKAGQDNEDAFFSNGEFSSKFQKNFRKISKLFGWILWNFLMVWQWRRVRITKIS